MSRLKITDELHNQQADFDPTRWTMPESEVIRGLEPSEFKDYLSVDKPLATVYGSRDHGLGDFPAPAYYVVEYRFARRILYEVALRDPSVADPYDQLGRPENLYFARISRPVLPTEGIQ